MLNYLFSFLMSVQPVTMKLHNQMKKPAAAPAAGAEERKIPHPGEAGYSRHELPDYLEKVIPSEEVIEFFNRK
jgi:hypothetical protein